MTALPTPANHNHWWVHTTSATRLHALPGTTINPDDSEELELFRWEGITTRAVCGRERTWWWPGVFSRLGLPRCGDCCDRLGIERGNGTPGNETAKTA